MHFKLPCSFIILGLAIFVVISTCGCSFLRNQEEINKKIGAVTQKKQNYNNLRNDIIQQRINAGISCHSVKELYGSPDDIFQSGSAVGNFEIWTYEKIYAKGEDGDWQNIRLYFNNNKLVSWEY